MKLKNKILPLVTIATAASVVTPLVTLTSCKKTNGNTYNLLTDYLPAVQPSGLESATNQEAITDYGQSVKAKPSIFVNDYITYLQTNLIAQTLTEDVTFNKFNVTITNPTIGSVNIAYPGEQSYAYTTISFSITIDEEHVYEYEDYTTTIHTSGTMQYKNIPLMVYNNFGNWIVCIDLLFTQAYSYILENDPQAWSVVGDVKRTTTNKYLDVAKVDTETKTAKINWSSIKDIRKYWGQEGDQVSPTNKKLGSASPAYEYSFLQGFLFHFKSTYFYNVEKKMEIVQSDILTFEVEVDPTLSAKTRYPAKINGLSLSYGKKARTEASNREQYTYTVNKDYELSFYDVYATPDTTTESTLYNIFRNAKLVIKAGTSVSVDENDYMTIESADSTSPTIYCEFPEAITLSQDVINAVLQFRMPNILEMKATSESGVESSVPVSIYAIDNMIECQVKGMFVPQADKTTGQVTSIDLSSISSEDWTDAIRYSYVEIPFTFTGESAALYFINDAKAEKTAWEAAEEGKEVEKQSITRGLEYKAFGDFVPVVMDSRYTEVQDSEGYWWTLQIVPSSSHAGFLRFYPQAELASRWAYSVYYGYPVTYTAKFNTPVEYYEEDYYPEFGLGYYIAGSSAQKFQYWTNYKNWDFTFKVTAA